ncbi:UL14 minor tegument protein [Meleagrid alphaherpesvirus 1]|uniref:UL14 minor tegument protein n=1 Tax=Meleagrid herpesvirus 1 TaxID=37108 RepID=Q9DPS1_MEHV1|nr:tegument protein UL14 [Meleagrid alphaherpesvirus 1]AKQ48635.1 tegument protein UL14 [iBAC vector pMeHV1-C7]AKQ48707.1 tegument protein UL14 [iBAC vector pMeHV1-C9]AKQ48779.1 tegument protein UL14 [iBAC vector pMeHV1-C10]AKQ48851.1 tegument protein UL14 [iBAC vector pMeHV1-C17]AKQ48924.1 tegument protein UL14 [iBAC vector pMeHV1-C18]
MFAAAAMRRRRRQLLAECRVRETIYKERTLELLSEGVGTDDPAFIATFTSARNAHTDHKAQLRSNILLENTERKLRLIERRIEDQVDRKLILETNRRFLSPELHSHLEQAEEDLIDKETILTEACEELTLADSSEDIEEFSETAEALLTKWILEQKPRPLLPTKSAAPPHARDGTRMTEKARVPTGVQTTNSQATDQNLPPPTTSTPSISKQVIHRNALSPEVDAVEDASRATLGDV